MTDLAKCAGRECPQREHCLRYTAPANERPLSSFDATRLSAIEAGFGPSCDGYIAARAPK